VAGRRHMIEERERLVLSCLVWSCLVLPDLTTLQHCLGHCLPGSCLPAYSTFACDCIILIIRCWLSAIHFTYIHLSPRVRLRRHHLHFTNSPTTRPGTTPTSKRAPIAFNTRICPLQQSHKSKACDWTRAFPTVHCALHDVCSFTPPSPRPHPSLATYRNRRNHFLRTKILTQSRQGQACRPRRHLLNNFLARCF